MHTLEFRIFALLLVLLFASIGSFLAYNALYTEGEVMQGICWLLVLANFPIFFVTLWKPRIGIWSAFAVAAILLPWQASENRKWAQIHEEIVSVIRHVEGEKMATGEFPMSLDGYEFEKKWIDEHVTYAREGDSFELTYFMDNAGITYWYNEVDGFGYYPD